MAVIFWAAIGLIVYTYIGYVAWLWGRSRWYQHPVRSAPYLPAVSIVLVARNEGGCVGQKIRNLLDINYPRDKAEIIVVSDGSTDATNRVLSEFATLSHVKTIFSQQSQGKAAGLSHAINAAVGQIIVFTDVRQQIEPDALLHLMENFADPRVGCASGELILGDPATGESTRRMGLYWKLEKLVRHLEAASGSVIGATGALYAVRRSLFVPVPVGTTLDDVFIPMEVIRQGSRVIIDPRARVWDVADLGTRREFGRKVRTLSGIYQLLQLQPWLLSNENPVRFEFVSHKLLRLAVPFALCAALVSSFFLPGFVYRVALFLQLGFYSLSLSKPLLKQNSLARIADVAFTFILLNAAALVAFANFVAGRKPAWGR